MKMKTGKIIVIIMTAAILLVLAGCGSRYRINVSDKSEWSKIKESYREGEKVVLYYNLEATDSSLSITVDGQLVPYEFVSGYGFRIEFIMPDHDVEIKAIWTADQWG